MTSIEVWIEADDISEADAAVIAARAAKYLAELALAEGYNVENEGHTIADAVYE